MDDLTLRYYDAEMRYPDPQEMMQTLAQTVFQGKSLDLMDTQQYGSLSAVSLGEEWSGFGYTMFVQPLTLRDEIFSVDSAAAAQALIADAGNRDMEGVE